MLQKHRRQPQLGVQRPALSHASHNDQKFKNTQSKGKPISILLRQQSGSIVPCSLEDTSEDHISFNLWHHPFYWWENWASERLTIMNNNTLHKSQSLDLNQILLAPILDSLPHHQYLEYLGPWSDSLFCYLCGRRARQRTAVWELTEEEGQAC